MTAATQGIDPAGRKDRKRIAHGVLAFVVLAFALSSVGYTATIVSGQTSILLLVAPALAALTPPTTPTPTSSKGY